MPAKKNKTKKKTILDTEGLRRSLKLKHLETVGDFKSNFPDADKFLKSKGIELGKIRQKSSKLLGASALAGVMLLNAPVAPELPSAHQLLLEAKEESTHKLQLPQTLLTNIFMETLPQDPRPLSRSEEKHLEKVFEDLIGVKARASLEGEHLNTTYGYIGAEQHLKRYPGDNLSNHSPDPFDYMGENPNEILKEGIAPGLGAWGYFAPSEEEITPSLEETERWYAVVQTLYLSDWNTRTNYLREWYKYRKVLIVNTENGKAVVAAIADSGPAAWTGKQFGGSPEVMDYLGGPKYKKGPVLVFFVDDPDNNVPLGPVEYNNIDLLKSAT